MKNEKLSLEEHVLLGQELSNIHQKIFELSNIVWAKSNKKSLIGDKIRKTIQSLTELKIELENELYKSHYEKSNTNIYYPVVLNPNSHYERHK